LEKHLSTDRPGPYGGPSTTPFRLRSGTKKIMDSPTKPRTTRPYSADRPTIIHGLSACEDLVQPDDDKLSQSNYRASADRPGSRADRPHGVTEVDSRWSVRCIRWRCQNRPLEGYGLFGP
jgi:hypothetical protein